MLDEYLNSAILMNQCLPQDPKVLPLSTPLPSETLVPSLLISPAQKHLDFTMRFSFLATLTWAVQLKALPSNISSAPADEALALPSELADGPVGPSRPWGSHEWFQKLDSPQSLCLETEHLELHNSGEVAPYVKDCKILRDQIAGKPGLWYIQHPAFFPTPVAICMYHFSFDVDDLCRTTTVTGSLPCVYC